MSPSKLIIPAIILFILNPFISIVLLGILLAIDKTIDKKFYYIFYLLLAFFLGFINMTKVPESDLGFHASKYLYVSQYSFLDYLSWFEKEPVFYAFNYIFYYISGGSVKFWVFVITVFPYFILFISLDKFHSKVNVNKRYILFSIVLAAFFPQLFSLSAHLIRQFIAGAIIVYFLVDKLIYGNNKWWLAILGVLIHSTSILIFPLAYLSFLKEKLGKGNIVYFVGLIFILFTYQYFAQLLLPYFTGIESIHYILERASVDNTFELEKFSALNYVFIGVLLVITLYNQYKEELDINITGFNHLANIILLFVIFILMNLRQTELALRLFFYLFFFFPLIVPLVLKKNPFDKKFSFASVSISIILFFFYRLDTGTWNYDDKEKIVLSSSFDFLSRPEPVVYDYTRYSEADAQ
ncbi:EpsG family protein [Adhaeribacter swui]|uniref:EpsG family protein n=1 Tax=Adhaeribacter swui TaxID=2086471 RepID=A0A7G7G590_9BACT|nr:EpsG family protein [Adhaeribacter swui]QNF32324.1 EpsG family protein [Adhaeribacter swui]